MHLVAGDLLVDLRLAEFYLGFSVVLAVLANGGLLGVLNSLLPLRFDVLVNGLSGRLRVVSGSLDDGADVREDLFQFGKCRLPVVRLCGGVAELGDEVVHVREDTFGLCRLGVRVVDRVLFLALRALDDVAGAVLNDVSQGGDPAGDGLGAFAQLGVELVGNDDLQAVQGAVEQGDVAMQVIQARLGHFIGRALALVHGVYQLVEVLVGGLHDRQQRGDAAQAADLGQLAEELRVEADVVLKLLFGCVDAGGVLLVLDRAGLFHFVGVLDRFGVLFLGGCDLFDRPPGLRIIAGVLERLAEIHHNLAEGLDLARAVVQADAELLERDFRLVRGLDQRR